MLSSLAIKIMQLCKMVDMIIHGIYGIFAHNKNSKVKSASHLHARATAKSKTLNVSDAIAYIIHSYHGVFFLYNVTVIYTLVERFE